MHTAWCVRLAGVLVGGAALGIAALATIVVVVLSAGGALTTPPGAWVVTPAVPGLRVEAQRARAAPLRHSPVGAAAARRPHGLQPHRQAAFARDGSALRRSARPAASRHRGLAAQTVYIDRLQLRLVQLDARTIAGELEGRRRSVVHGAVQPERIDRRLRLPRPRSRGLPAAGLGDSRGAPGANRGAHRGARQPAPAAAARRVDGDRRLPCRWNSARRSLAKPVEFVAPMQQDYRA